MACWLRAHSVLAEDSHPFPKHPHPVPPAPGHAMPSSDILGHLYSSTYTHTQTHTQTLTHIIKNNKKILGEARFLLLNIIIFCVHFSGIKVTAFAKKKKK